MRDNVLIIVPVFVKKGEDTTGLKKRIYALTELGKVHLINQGERIYSPEEEEKNSRVFVQYEEKPLGIWGALEKAFWIRVDDPDLYPGESVLDMPGPTSHVVLNLAPLHFEAETLKRFIYFAERGNYDHLVGRRSDIAGSLSDDPKIGRARALMECFLTVLASVIQTDKPDAFEDGFSGLHAFSSGRYLMSKWEWVKKTTWGGALESQMQSRGFGYEVKYFPIFSAKRNYGSTLGADMKAVVNMLDQARNLPIYERVTPADVERALDSVGWVFASQPWLEPETAREETTQLLEFYNTNTEKGEFLKIK